MTPKCAHGIRRAAWLGVVLVFGHFCCPAAAIPQTQQATKTEFLVSKEPGGKRGGRLVLSLRAEPKTLNPIIAGKAVSGRKAGALRRSFCFAGGVGGTWAISAEGVRGRAADCAGAQSLLLEDGFEREPVAVS